MRTVGLTLAAALLLLLSTIQAGAQTDDGWTIRSFDASYAVNPDGTVGTVEDILVDFGFLQRHGIFRDIPVEYAYDDENNRLIRLTGITVDDGQTAHPFEVTEEGPNIRIRIGDPDVLVTGQQRYRISYTINGGLNPFADHDEFYWNVTGNEWPVPIERSSARLSVPEPGIQDAACYQGLFGSAFPCEGLTFDAASVRADNGPLGPGAGITLVTGLEKGLVPVPPPELVDAETSPAEAVDDFLGLHPWTIVVAVLLGIAGIFAVLRQWWISGRDRWYGDLAHAGGTPTGRRKPLFAHETIVTQFTPPDVDGATPGRRLLPAEIGLLVDERADTLDVTATIVDLAVRKYLVISETESGGILGVFKKKDYVLERLEPPAGSLAPYEQKLLDSLFEDGSPVKLSDLKNEFYDDLKRVKDKLISGVTRDLKLFPRSPEKTRRMYRVVGFVVAGAGVILTVLLGTIGAGIIGIPIVIAGVLMLLLAPSMPRRTPEGRELYRLSLGFRTYIERAETERQAFAERANLFEEYLPYAIVFECVDKWAKAFEGLGDEAPQPSWYRGTHPFVATHFASSVGDFSESISSVMASTPGGKGGSGFGGGGFSGGGGGGGGGGSW
jgi:uncharacterized protein (TIGR04222 family)